MFDPAAEIEPRQLSGGPPRFGPGTITHASARVAAGSSFPIRASVGVRRSQAATEAVAPLARCTGTPFP
jgi:hypothetical protein